MSLSLTTESRICAKCGDTKPTSEYYLKADRNGRKRLTAACKECTKAASKAYYREHAEHAIAKKREYVSKPEVKAKIRERQKQYLANLPDEERERRNKLRDQSAKKRREKKIQTYIAKFGHPLCACGCGEKVRFNKNCKPNKFINNHVNTNREMVMNRLQTEDRIPAEKVRNVFLDLRAKKGMTLQEFAEKAGVSTSVIRKILHTPGPVSGYRRDMIEEMLKRLSGIPMPPSEYQLKQMEKKKRFQLPNGEYYERVG